MNYKYTVELNFDDDDGCPTWCKIEQWLNEKYQHQYIKKISYTKIISENYGWWKYSHIPRFRLNINFKTKKDAMLFKLVWGC